MTSTTLLGTHPSGSVTTARKTMVVWVVPDIGAAASGVTESWCPPPLQLAAKAVAIVGERGQEAGRTTHAATTIQAVTAAMRRIRLLMRTRVFNSFIPGGSRSTVGRARNERLWAHWRRGAGTFGLVTRPRRARRSGVRGI